MRLKIKNQLLSPELSAIIYAAKQRLPEMIVCDTTLNDAANFKKMVQLWQEKRGNDGAFCALIGAFFQVQMCNVTVLAGEKQTVWVQPGIIAKAEAAEDQNGNAINLAGLVINLYDTDGRMLVRMNNEPFAHAEFIDGREIHPKIQPSMQTSITKMAAVMAGDVDKDQSLAALFGIFKDNNWSLDDLEWYLTDTAHDGNRIQGEVAYSCMELTPDDLETIAAKINGFILDGGQIAELFEKQPHLLNAHFLLPV